MILGSLFGFLLAPVSVSFFDTFSGPLLERPWDGFGRILTPFWLNFGSVLGVFWGPLRKVKIELSLKREPHFHCPRGSENHSFFDLLSERPPEHPPEPLLESLARFWLDFGVPWGPYFPSFFVPFFELDF